MSRRRLGSWPCVRLRGLRGVDASCWSCSCVRFSRRRRPQAGRVNQRAACQGLARSGAREPGCSADQPPRRLSYDDADERRDGEEEADGRRPESEHERKADECGAEPEDERPDADAGKVPTTPAPVARRSASGLSSALGRHPPRPPEVVARRAQRRAGTAAEHDVPPPVSSRYIVARPTAQKTRPTSAKKTATKSRNVRLDLHRSAPRSRLSPVEADIVDAYRRRRAAAPCSGLVDRDGARDGCSPRPAARSGSAGCAGEVVVGRRRGRRPLQGVRVPRVVAGGDRLSPRHVEVDEEDRAPR